MKLIDYIKAHGVAECAARFGVSEATIKAYRYGWRQPRPEVANRIVSVTGGEVTLAGIYAPPAPSSKGRRRMLPDLPAVADAMEELLLATAEGRVIEPRTSPADGASGLLVDCPRRPSPPSDSPTGRPFPDSTPPEAPPGSGATP